MKNKILSIEEGIAELRKPLIIYGISVVLVNFLILGLGVINSLGHNESSEYSTFETCLYGFNQIIQNNPTEDLISESVIKDLEKVKFKSESIHLIKKINSFSCDVFIKEPKGVRRYLVTLEKNAKFPHLYRIFDVKGAKINSRYQL